jgi:hypothetical protein
MAKNVAQASRLWLSEQRELACLGVTFLYQRHTKTQPRRLCHILVESLSYICQSENFRFTSR